MQVLIAFVSHRVEFLPILLRLVRKCKNFVLEEPMTLELNKLLSGEMDIDEYIMWVNTPFPVYTLHLMRALLDLKNRGLKVLPVEPYLQIVEGIHEAVEANRYDEYVKNEVVQKVLKVEREATGALIEYHEAFMSRDFDSVVEATLKFAKADAKRFVLRDKMRADKIAEINENCLVEAGQIHFLLEEELKNRAEVSNVDSVNIVEKVANTLGIDYVKNPGNELTEIYIKEIIGEEFNGDVELLAAQALIYITLVSKEEMVPEEGQFPHLLDEVKCAKIARSMSYDNCRKFMNRVWFGRSKN
jgi:hypothetical protein